MRINKLSNKILQNRYFLKGLEKISEHGTSFAAATSLVLSTSLRPFAINKTPDTETENKQYAMANSICSGLIKFGIVEAVALPIENAVKKIDKNSKKFLTARTIDNLSKNPRAYKLLTQTIKLSTGFFTAIPKSMLTIALIPIVMDKLFFRKFGKETKPVTNYHQPTFFVGNNNVNFTGGLNETLAKGLAKIIDKEKLQQYAIKYQSNDKDIAKHITAGTDVLLTSAFAYNTNKSKDIKENRKKALIYNNIISTAITLIGGYLIDGVVKNKNDKFIEKFKKLNASNPNISKCVEGINILRPALIFAGIYYCILPIFSTYMGEKIDKFIQKNTNKNESS